MSPSSQEGSARASWGLTLRREFPLARLWAPNRHFCLPDSWPGLWGEEAPFSALAPWWPHLAPLRLKQTQTYYGVEVGRMSWKTRLLSLVLWGETGVSIVQGTESSQPVAGPLNPSTLGGLCDPSDVTTAQLLPHLSDRPNKGSVRGCTSSTTKH
jgi:hypothetical protein